MPAKGSGDSPSEESVPRHRPLVPVLIGIALGILADETFRPPVLFWVWLAVPALMAAFWAWRSRLKPWGNWALALMVALPLGGGLHMWRARLKPPYHLKNLSIPERSLYYVRGRVSKEPALHFAGRVFASPDTAPRRFYLSYIDLEALSGDGRNWQRAAGGIAVFVDKGRPAVRPGDRVQFLGMLRKNPPPSNPGEMDFRKIYELMGSYGTASVNSGDDIEVLRRSPWYVSPVGKLRAHLKKKLIWDADRPVDGLTGALIFGERGRLLPEVKELLQESGSLHFLAISGLHVGIFAGFVWGVLVLTGVPSPARSLLLLVLVWVYVLFTGAHVSAARAGWMVTAMVSAPLLGRQQDMVSALVAAALAILLVWPQQLFATGFQLTFVAVWAIVYLYRHVCRILWPWDHFVMRVQRPEERGILSELWLYGRYLLLLSLCVWVATLPIRMARFNTLSALTPLSNVLIWPLVLVLQVQCFCLALAALAGGLGTGLLVHSTAFFSHAIVRLLRMLSHLPGFAIYTSAPPVWWMVVFYTVVALWVLRLRLRGARKFVLAASLLLALGYIWNDYAAQRVRGFRMTVCDVGHGQAILLRFPSGTAALCDAGSYSTSRARAVADVLWRYHVKELDTVVLSHREFDHCSFLPHLRRRFGIRRVVMPFAGETTGFGRNLERELRRTIGQVMKVKEEDKLTAPGFECLVLHPDSRFILAPEVGENDKSAVLLCRYGNLRMLLTGDIGPNAMTRLIEDYGQRLKADVLVMPHHGAYSERLAEFAALVRPAVALASCASEAGVQESRAALEKLGIPLLTTAADGALIVELDEGEAVASGYRSDRRVRFRPAGHPQ